MKKYLFLIAFTLLTVISMAQNVADFIRTKKTGKQNVVDARLKAYLNLSIPKGTSWTLNGAKDSIGYIMFNTTLNRFGVYVGSGVWDVYTTKQDVVLNQNLAAQVANYRISGSAVVGSQMLIGSTTPIANGGTGSMAPLEIAGTGDGVGLAIANSSISPTAESYIMGQNSFGGIVKKTAVLAFRPGDNSADGYGGIEFHASKFTAGVNQDHFGISYYPPVGMAVFPAGWSPIYHKGERKMTVYGWLDTERDINGEYAGISSRNLSTGTSAANRFRLGNNASANAFTIDVRGSNYTGAANYVDIMNQFSAPLRLGGYGDIALVLGSGNTVKIPALAGASVRMATIGTDGTIGAQTIPSGGGGGAVTNIGIASANGLGGSSDGDPNNPTLTLRSTVTADVLKSNGTSISAATTTGSGDVVLANTPTLITPVLGVATGTRVSLSDSTNSSYIGFAARNPSVGTSASTRFALGNNASSNAFTIDARGSNYSGGSNYVDLMNQFSAPLRLGGFGAVNLFLNEHDVTIDDLAIIDDLRITNTPSAGATGYHILVRDDSDGSVKQIATPSGSGSVGMVTLTISDPGSNSFLTFPHGLSGITSTSDLTATFRTYPYDTIDYVTSDATNFYVHLKASSVSGSKTVSFSYKP